MRVKMRKLRESYGFTQRTFSQAIGVSRTHYTQIETGEKGPSLELALRIKRALNYYDDDIFANTTLSGKRFVRLRMSQNGTRYETKSRKRRV